MLAKMKVSQLAALIAVIMTAAAWAPLFMSESASAVPVQTLRLDFFPQSNLQLASEVGAPAATEALPSVGSILVTGTFSVTWTYSPRSGSSHLPIAGAYVELWRGTISGHVVEATTFTDAEGKVIFQDVASGKLAAVIFANDHSAVKVKDGEGYVLYSWTTGWKSHAGGTSIDNNINDDHRGVWSTYSAIRTAYAWLEDRTNYQRGMVTVNWPDGDWPHSHGDEIDLPDSGDYDDSIWDTATVIHEYGHCIQYNLLGDRFPEGDGPDPHYIYSESSPGFAFSEGWAQFFASGVLNNPARSGDRTNLESTIYADGSFGWDGDYGDWDGNIVEGAVANVLWDIFDGISDSDKPSFGSTGDRVDQQFHQLWSIMLDHQAESIDEIWTYWDGKDANLQSIFYNARIRKDTSLPVNPNAYTSSHQIGVESDDSTITVTLVGASDSGGEVAGYSVLWDNDALGMPDAIMDVGGSTVVSPVLSSGVNWYLHVRAVDGSGNWANYSYDMGPFAIAEGAVAQGDPSSPVSGWIPAAAGMAMVCVIIIALAAISSSNTARKKREQQEALRLQQMQYQMQYQYQFHGGAGMQSNQVPQNTHVSSYMAPVCPRCGRVDMGSTYCPYCGGRMR
jgi:hypothetical protein